MLVRMDRFRPFRIGSLAFMFLLSVTFLGGRVWAAKAWDVKAWALNALAANETAAEPVLRQAYIIVSYVKYEWWLMYWADNRIICQMNTDHEGWPTGEEIYASCGPSVHSEWLRTPACQQLEQGGDTTLCAGVYLFLIGNQPAEKTILVDLPPIQVWMTLSGCTPTSPENLCPEIPSILLTGEEPLPNEQITAINAVLGGQNYQCSAVTCTLPLAPTPLEGLTVEFWANSSYGDSSEHFTAQVRVVDSGVQASEVPTMPAGWYVDVLGKQWRGAQIASCAQVWQAFPPVGGPPPWLTTPEVSNLLATDTPYYFLAGQLISQGLVDASGCPDGGLLANGYADICGLEAARPLVVDWQNRFDERIIAVAHETGVPGQLMKNLFAQESQFWPGAFKDPNEFGLGQLTENGAETVLLWNPDFFTQFCPLVLDETTCQNGYLYLEQKDQATLRGALALQAKSDCADCQAGIDLSHADFSVKLFAQTLLANCEQVAQIVYNGTDQIAGKVSNYEDLWRFTLANYHAGAGCLSYAVYTTWSSGIQDITWANVSAHLTEPCQGVISYVQKVAK
jgi:hypothetical protein